MVPFTQALLVEAYRRGWLPGPALGELGALTASAKRDRDEWIAANAPAVEAAADLTSPDLWDWMEAAEYPASHITKIKRELTEHPDDVERALRVVWNAADRMAGGDDNRRNLALLDLFTRWNIRAQPGTVDVADAEYEAAMAERQANAPYTRSQVAQLSDLVEAGLITQAELNEFIEETFNEPTYGEAKERIERWVDRALHAGNRDRLPPWWPEADPRHRAPRNCPENTIPIATFVVRAHCRRRPQPQEADLGEGPKRKETAMPAKKKSTKKPAKKAAKKATPKNKPAKKAASKKAASAKKKANAKPRAGSKKASKKKKATAKKKASGAETLGHHHHHESADDQYGFISDVGRWFVDAIASKAWDSAKNVLPFLRLFDGTDDLPRLLGEINVIPLSGFGASERELAAATRRSDAHEKPTREELRRRANAAAEEAARARSEGAKRQAAAHMVGHLAALLELYPESDEARAIQMAPAPTA